MEFLIAPDFLFWVFVWGYPSMFCEFPSFLSLIIRCLGASIPSRNKCSKKSSSQIRTQIIDLWQQQTQAMQNFLDSLASSPIKRLASVGLTFIIRWWEKEWSTRWQLLFLFCLAKAFQKYQGECWQLSSPPYFFFLPPHIPIWQMCPPRMWYI